MYVYFDSADRNSMLNMACDSRKATTQIQVFSSLLWSKQRAILFSLFFYGIGTQRNCMQANAGVIMCHFRPSYPIDACCISAECDATNTALQNMNPMPKQNAAATCYFRTLEHSEMRLKVHRGKQGLPALWRARMLMVATETHIIKP